MQAVVLGRCDIILVSNMKCSYSVVSGMWTSTEIETRVLEGSITSNTILVGVYTPANYFPVTKF